jgi:mannosyltransferase OCH1-like enzyme
MIKSEQNWLKAGERTIHYKIHKLIIFIWNKEELPEEWKNSIIVPIYKTDCSNFRGT